MRYTLTCRTHFDAAHFLPQHEGQCRNLHGHRWNVEVVVESDRLNPQGMIVDFGVIKKVVSEFDHKMLNDTITNPTAEVIVAMLFTRLCDKGLAVKSVEVWESPDCSVRVCSE